MKRNLVIGTRGSKMALVQTDRVARALTERFPEVTIETRVIVTKGDQNMAPIPLDTVGKAWFTKEIEVALAKGDIDLAVHSFKDLAPEPPEGLLIQPVLIRDDPRDVLVPRHAGTKLQDLPQGAVIGTDSLRRKAGLLRLRPDLDVRSIRGNVVTRLEKLLNQDYDAIVVAAAGLERINAIDKASEWFDVAQIVPAVGQGVLAAEVRADDHELWDMVQALTDGTTAEAVAAEQAFSMIIGGGCKLPVSCYVSFEGDTANVVAMVGSADASECTVKQTSGSRTEAVAIAKDLAHTLLNEPFMKKD